jgi:hypothetical protein
VVEEWGAKIWALPEVMPRSAWPGREYTMVLLAQVRHRFSAVCDASASLLPLKPLLRKTN